MAPLFGWWCFFIYFGSYCLHLLYIFFYICFTPSDIHLVVLLLPLYNVHVCFCFSVFLFLVFVFFFLKSSQELLSLPRFLRPSTHTTTSTTLLLQSPLVSHQSTQPLFFGPCARWLSDTSPTSKLTLCLSL